MNDEIKLVGDQLVDGGPLIMEDLDTSGLGLYKIKDPSVSEDDYVLSGYTWHGQPLWKRKSEEGKKWHVFEDTIIKLHKTLK